MNYEENLLFTKDHVWMKKKQENIFQLGITNFAQDLLGDIVFIDIVINKVIEAGQPLGSIESVKTASDFICPDLCTIRSINKHILKSPELINDNPYQTWICEVEFVAEIRPEKFLTHQKYEESIG